MTPDVVEIRRFHAQKMRELRASLGLKGDG